MTTGVSMAKQAVLDQPEPQVKTLAGAAVSVEASCRVLLVGQRTSWGISLLSSLQRLGSEFSFASPLRVTSEYVRELGRTLVLIASTAPPGYRKQLVSGLIGSDVSIFYAYPVEIGCWWVPALVSGMECHGSPAFRTKEFLAELERILRGGART